MESRDRSQLTTAPQVSSRSDVDNVTSPRSEIAKLVVEGFFIDFDPPALRLSIRSIRPSISPSLEMIFQVERAVFRENANARPLVCFKKFGERRPNHWHDFAFENLWQQGRLRISD